MELISITDYVERFNSLNQTAHQQSMLAEISQIRGYQDNNRFNLANAVQIYSLEILLQLLGDSSIYHLCFHSRTGECLVYGKMLIPGFTPTGELITYICYDVINQQLAKHQGVSQPAYFLPESNGLTSKSNFVYAPIESWERILSSEDIYIVDGIWDCVSLNLAGYPSIAILGSSLSNGVIHILKAFKRLYIITDNDAAGGLLYNNMSYLFPYVYRVIVPIELAKDIDQYIVKVGFDWLKSQLRTKVNISLQNKPNKFRSNTLDTSSTITEINRKFNLSI